MTARPPLRIVALHGNTGAQFSSKVGSIRTECKRCAVFSFPDGPVELAAANTATVAHAGGSDDRDHQPVRRPVDDELRDDDAKDSRTTDSRNVATADGVDGAIDNRLGRDASESARAVPPSQRTASQVPVHPGGRSWYDFSKIEAGTSTSYDGVDACFASLDAYCRDHGPFDGVMGFSQGAVVAAIWLAKSASLPPHMQVRFGIFFSGLLPNDATLREFLTRGPSTPPVTPPAPQLHIYGEADAIIVPDWSRGLMAAMQQWGPCTAVTHEGGHVVPSGVRKQVRVFLESIVP